MNLLLDDSPERTPEFLFKKTNNPVYKEPWVIVKNYNEFVEHIEKNGLPKLISFDHDLADEHYAQGVKNFDYSIVKEKTGYHCAEWLIGYCIDHNLSYPDYLVHSFSNVGKKNIHFIIQNFINNYTAAS